jgi:N-dimethylarginine dimethylaminohydrolase
VAAVKDKILMCPPDFFTVEYVINPWMAGHETSLDSDLARQQWHALKDAISEVAEVVVMEPQPELPDKIGRASCRERV